MDASDFVASMSDSVGSEPAALAQGAAASARTIRPRRKSVEGPERLRRKRALPCHQGAAEGELGGSLQGANGGEFNGKIAEELERLGGVDNVPPLSTLIQQLESQGANTL